MRYSRVLVSRQAGSVTIWGIGLTLVIAAFAGLVIDTWRVFADRQDLAGMADAAPTAAVIALTDSPYAMGVDKLGDGVATNCGPPYVLSPS